ncbi:carbohydrate ABC transporter permease [Listeria booriae]|uniref:carbohydrate ABC transporter permease n=1 Tax=Listeria booriae TaxID=1552123 RepID=UPI0016299B2F|nr:carbohydrate ABC transporter permease [Listeria booriae]MBC1974008.1 carbohydrate ABC transporter permease [Listeria booriae]MBC2031716.1 carbohydrate ABC transporter permease [Listeria booriae]
MVEAKHAGVGKWVVNGVLIILAIIWIFPFLYVIVNAVKSSAEYSTGNFWDLPKSFSISENWQYLTQQIQLGSGFLNSMIYGALGGALGIIMAALAAYAIETLKIKHGLLWFFVIYSGTIFPFQVYLIPIFKAYNKVGLYDTRFGMILIYAALIIPFSVFVLRNFLMGVSKEMLESARIDGASDFYIFRKIYMPMARAPLAAVFLFQFTWIWSDLLFGMTLTKSESARPVMASVSLLGGATIQKVPPILLAAIIVSIPTIILFVLSHRNLEKGFIVTTK